MEASCLFPTSIANRSGVLDERLTIQTFPSGSAWLTSNILTASIRLACIAKKSGVQPRNGAFGSKPVIAGLKLHQNRPVRRYQCTTAMKVLNEHPSAGTR